MIIDAKRLNELLEAEAKLNALEGGGVDNWDWYDASLEDHYVAPQPVEDIVLMSKPEYDEMSDQAWRYRECSK